MLNKMDEISVLAPIRRYWLGNLAEGSLVYASYKGVFAAFLGLATKDEWDYWPTERWSQVAFLASELGERVTVQATLEVSCTYILIVAKLQGYNITSYRVECRVIKYEFSKQAAFGFSVGAAVTGLSRSWIHQATPTVVRRKRIGIPDRDSRHKWIAIGALSGRRLIELDE